MPDEDASALRATERWFMRRGLPHFIAEYNATHDMWTRALPLVALLVTLLFLTTEVWQTAGSINGAPYWIAVSLFPLVAVLFLVAKLPQQVGERNDFADRDELHALTVGAGATISST